MRTPLRSDESTAPAVADLRPSPAVSIGRLVLALIVGVAAGAITEGLVLRAPFSLLPLTNSAAPWVLVTFAVSASARDVREAVVLAIVTFLALVLGFYLAQATRGWTVSHHQIAFWSAASLVAGPLVGVSAGWLRFGPRLLGAVGAGAIGGILVGEAIDGLRKPWFLTPHGYWHVQLLAGIAIGIGPTVWCSRHHRPRDLAAALIAAAASGAIVGLATYLAYRIP